MRTIRDMNAISGKSGTVVRMVGRAVVMTFALAWGAAAGAPSLAAQSPTFGL
jgi:hypothetical protein